MKLVNLSEMPWTAELRRNAAIFRELVRAGTPYDGGIFVGPVDYLGRDASIAARAHATRANFTVRDVESAGVALKAYDPTVVLPSAPVEKAHLMLFRRVIERALRGEPFALWINCVERLSFALAEVLAPHAAHVVIDLSDDWTAFHDLDPAARDARLARAIELSDALLAVNPHVLAKFPHRDPARGRVFANATDFDNFQKHDRAFVLADVLPKPAGRKLVGFSGGLNVGRVDEALVERLIAELPDAHFVFVGYSNSPELVARITANPHVRVLPAVPFRDLPHVIKAFDVAIIPHAINEHTRGNDLLKVLDYMASGVPIVSTDCSNVRAKYGAAVAIADTHDDFLARVRGVLDGSAPAHDPEPGLAIARAASWANQVPALAEWLAQTFPG